MGLPCFWRPTSSGRRTIVVKDLFAATKPNIREQPYDFLEIPKTIWSRAGFAWVNRCFSPRKALDSPHVAVALGFLFASFIPDLS